MARRLGEAGYRIVARNWRIRGGEIDLVALHGEELVFVEVRARSSVASGRAAESVDARKLRHLMTAAAKFIERHPEHEDRIWRLDLVAITLDRHGDLIDFEHFHDLTLD